MGWFQAFLPNRITNFNDFKSTKHKGKLVENTKELVKPFNPFFVKAGSTPAWLGGSSKPQNDRKCQEYNL